MHTDISKLEFGVAAAFIIPVVAYAIGRAWNSAVGGSFPKLNRVWATFCLLMPIVALGMMVRAGFETVRSVWIESPLVATTAYFFIGIVAPLGLIYLVLHLWRPRR
jgi:hypothetical protein